MIPKEKQAAQMLEGKVLKNGWKVVRKIDRPMYHSGGTYSCCYEVCNGDRKGFLKAFDLSSAEKIGVEAREQIRNILNAFELERRILETCSKKGCKNVITLLDSGDIEIEGAQKYPRVDYIILEYAEKGDIRDAIEQKRADVKFKISSLHQLAKGLNQIHAQEIAHQDIKPSNLVTTVQDQTKLTDFGSATFLNSSGIELPHHIVKDYAGSYEYAPPELLYGFTSEDSTIRRIGCDLYLLGSMVVFYVANVSMTALIRSNLSETLCWTNPGTHGKFLELKSYLIQAYEMALEDLANTIGDKN